jgi:hypothetical protein
VLRGKSFGMTEMASAFSETSSGINRNAVRHDRNHVRLAAKWRPSWSEMASGLIRNTH